MVSFDPDTDIPNLTGKTILVTGGTAGLGKETILHLAPHTPSHIIFTGRSVAASESILSTFRTLHPSVNITFVPCDLASLASVRQSAQSILSLAPHLDIILLIAGIMALPPALTPDGYELQFGTNHLGHALLVRLLLPSLRRHALAGADVRIISYSSDAARTLAPACGIDFPALTTVQDDFYIMGSWRRYGQSKLANALYARALARRYPEILSVSIHPGVAMTGMVEQLPFASRWLVKLTTMDQAKTPREVAMNGLWAAVAGRADGKGDNAAEKLGKIENGVFYRPIGSVDFKVGMTRDDELTERLWDWTEEQLKDWIGSDGQER